MIGVNQLGITVCSLVLGAVGEPAVAHLVEPVLHALHLREGLLPRSVRDRAGGGRLSARRARRDDPQNIAAAPDRAALVLGPPIWAIVTVLRPVVVVINAMASGVLRLLGARLTDEVASTYAVAALVESPRRGPSGRRITTGSPARSVHREDRRHRLDAAGLADHRAAWHDRCRRRGPVRLDRVQPFPVTLRATCSLPAHQDVLETDGRAAKRGRGQVDQAVRDRGRGRPLHDVLGDPQRRGAYGAGRRRRRRTLGLATLSGT